MKSSRDFPTQTYPNFPRDGNALIQREYLWSRWMYGGPLHYWDGKLSQSVAISNRYGSTQSPLSNKLKPPSARRLMSNPSPRTAKGAKHLQTFSAPIVTMKHPKIAKLLKLCFASSPALQKFYLNLRCGLASGSRITSSLEELYQHRSQRLRAGR